MRNFMIALVVVSAGLAGAADASPRHVRGYVKQGRYVAPHFQTAPDRTRLNNYSTRGNTNPFTGKRGSKSPFRSR
jgi:hypothetical protein